MKEHLQERGVRKWAGDDLIELQSEPLAAVQELVEPYAPCVLKGCEVESDGNGRYNLSAGLAVLRGTDVNNNSCTKIVRVAAQEGIDLPVYLTIAYKQHNRLYADNVNKAIAYDYYAGISSVRPDNGTPYLEITANSVPRLLDTMLINEKVKTDGGEAGETKVTFATASSRTALSSASRLKILIGQISKWLNDLKAHAFRSIQKADFDASLQGELDLKVDRTEAGLSAAINTLSTNSAVPSDDDYYVSQYVNGGTTNTLYRRRPLYALWSYIKSKMASDSGVNTSGNSATATKLKTARTIHTNLGSTTAGSFDGSANITPGVTGTLPVANGGTGQTNLDNVTVGKAKQLNIQHTIDGVEFDGTADLKHVIQTGYLGTDNTSNPATLARPVARMYEHNISSLYNGLEVIFIMPYNYSSEYTNYVYFRTYLAEGTYNLCQVYYRNQMVRANQLSANTPYKFRFSTANNRWILIEDIDATTEAGGLLSAADKEKLDGVATGANNYAHPSYTARTGVATGAQTPGFGSTFNIDQFISDATGHISGRNTRTVKIPNTTATTSAAGLMSADDKSKLDNWEIYGIYNFTSSSGVYRRYGPKLECNESTAAADNMSAQPHWELKMPESPAGYTYFIIPLGKTTYGYTMLTNTAGRGSGGTFHLYHVNPSGSIITGSGYGVLFMIVRTPMSIASNQ